MSRIDIPKLMAEIKERQQLAEAEAIAADTSPKLRVERIKRGTEAMMAERERLRRIRAEELVIAKTQHMPRRASSNVGISRKALVPKRGEKAGPLRD